MSMNREDDLDGDPPEEEIKSDNVAPLPMLKAYGTGYITKKDGTVIHFTLEGDVDANSCR